MRQTAGQARHKVRSLHVCARACFFLLFSHAGGFSSYRGFCVVGFPGQRHQRHCLRLSKGQDSAAHWDLTYRMRTWLACNAEMPGHAQWIARFGFRSRARQPSNTSQKVEWLLQRGHCLEATIEAQSSAFGSRWLFVLGVSQQWPHADQVDVSGHTTTRIDLYSMHGDCCVGLRDGYVQWDVGILIRVSVLLA